MISSLNRLGLLSATAIPFLLGLTAWNFTRTDALPESVDAFSSGDFQTSLRASLDTLERRPWSREANLIAARSLSKLDYPDAAEPFYRRFDDLSLDDLQIRAYGLVRSNQRTRAIEAYESLLKRFPNDVLALRRLAGVQMTQADDDEVLRLAGRLIDIPEGAVFGYTLRGVVEHNQRNREDSVAAFVKVVELDPEMKIMPLPTKIFWGYFAYDLLDLGRAADVCRYLKEEAEKTNDPYLMDALGKAYYQEGDENEARIWFRKAADWDLEDPISRLFLGKILLHEKKREDAIPFLEEAVRVGPKHYDSLYTLAMTYRQLGRIAESDALQPRIDAMRDLPKAPAPTPSRKPPHRYEL